MSNKLPVLPADHTSADLLLWVKDRIKEEPQAFDMRHWASMSFRLENVERAVRTLWRERNFNDQVRHQCGTTLCIAGWVNLGYFLARDMRSQVEFEISIVFIGDRDEEGHEERDVEQVAYEALVDYPNEPLHNLFRANAWPDEYRQRYVNATSIEEMSQVAGEVIDLFIQDPEDFGRFH